MRLLKIVLSALVFFAISSTSAFAEVYSYGKDNTVIGVIKTHKVNGNESLIEIARNYDVGYNEIVDANPKLDPFLPGSNSTVNIPTIWILPDVPLKEGKNRNNKSLSTAYYPFQNYEGIVINLSEMRLYYFFRQNKGVSKKSQTFWGADKVSLVRTFPIGIGDEGNDTPVGTFRIIEKIANPSWHVPESIKKERRPGLPDVVPPGPENPLGTHALRLSLGSYLIHGTNRPWAVGRKVTHGCIRLYPEDIPKLFQIVPKGTKVAIVRQPVKVGIKDNKVYIEVHKDDHEKNINYFNEAVGLLKKKGLIKKINTEKLYHAVKEKSGIPVEISGSNLDLPQKIFAENFLREGKITSSSVIQMPF